MFKYPQIVIETFVLLFFLLTAGKYELLIADVQIWWGSQITWKFKI